MKLKTVFWGVIAAFVLTSIVQSPVESASFFKTLLIWIASSVHQIFAFFGALMPSAGG